MQYGATQGKEEQGKLLNYAGIADPSNPLQRLMHHS